MIPSDVFQFLTVQKDVFLATESLWCIPDTWVHPLLLGSVMCQSVVTYFKAAILTCSGRVRPALFLLSLLWSKVGCTEYRELSFLLYQPICHSELRCSLLSKGSRSVCGISETSGS